MSQLTKLEYRSVIKFLTKEGNTPNQIKQRLDRVYGDLSPSYSTVKKWAKCFRLGQESLEDDERLGRPIEVLTPQNISIIEELVLQDRRLKVRELAAMSNMSETSVRRILHDHLNMNKVSARWVPRLLSALQRQRRVECARSFLVMCGDDPQPILESIVTGDETMVLYYDPLSKRESMEWRRPDERRPIKAKVVQSTKKVMATIFWDCKGILLIDFKERNTTVNGIYYASLLHKLRDNIREKRRGRLSKVVRLLHDNAPVHTAAVSQEAIRECGFQEMEHPPYSPDMAPSDYYLFSNLKKDLRGRRFHDDNELQTAVMQHFEGKTADYFHKGIELLIDRCNKCIELSGDYIEK